MTSRSCCAQVVDARASCSRRGALRRIGAICALAPLAPTLARCAARDARHAITVYTSADDALARQVFAACSRATGIEITGLFDTEATKTTALESRIRAERGRPRADIFWSSEGFAVLRLAADGLLAEVAEPEWSAWPTAHRDVERRWLAFAARARVVVARRGGGPVTHWAELGAPALAERRRDQASTMIAIADPRFGTTGPHLAALRQSWGAAREGGREAPDFDAWLDGMRANGVRIYPGGNAATVDAVVRGECSFALTDTDDALVAIERGQPIEMFLPRTLPAGDAGGGTMLVPNTVAPVAGGPAPAELRDSVIRFLVSEECERLIAASASRNLPLGAGRSVELPYAEPDPLAFDAVRASAEAATVASAAKLRLEGADAREATATIGSRGSGSVGVRAGNPASTPVGRGSERS